MSIITYTADDDFARAMEESERMADWAATRARLGKLTVAELRLLHIHYFERAAMARELNKECLIDDLVEPIFEDGR